MRRCMPCICPKKNGTLALHHDDLRTWVPFGTGSREFFINRDIEHSFVKENNGIEGADAVWRRQPFLTLWECTR